MVCSRGVPIQEIDELVDEWVPEPLAQPLSPAERADLGAVPIVAGPNGPKPKLVATGKTATNLASLNFAGLAGNEHIKQRAIETLRKYGLGSCGPPGFYGTVGASIPLQLLLVFVLAEIPILKTCTSTSNATLPTS